MSHNVISCRHAPPLPVSSCHITSFHDAPRPVTPYHVMSHHVTSCPVASCLVTSRHFVPRHATLRHVMSHHCMSHHVKSFISRQLKLRQGFIASLHTYHVMKRARVSYISLHYSSAGPSIVPVCAWQQYRHYSGNRH